jgi:hypothetical protein
MENHSATPPIRRQPGKPHSHTNPRGASAPLAVKNLQQRRRKHHSEHSQDSQVILSTLKPDRIPMIEFAVMHCRFDASVVPFVWKNFKSSAA